MPEYEKMYYLLFNAISDAIWKLEQNDWEAAREILKNAQINSEEIYINE